MNTNRPSDTAIQADYVRDFPAAEVIIGNTAPDLNSAKRGLLLRMGNSWLEQGELRQAVDVYLQLCEQYPDSDEGQTAQAGLFKIAQRYEQEGLLRLSLDILERLEQTL